MPKLENGEQSVEILIKDSDTEGKGQIMFCTNGWHSTGVILTVEQYDMLKELLVYPEVVEFYEKRIG